MSEKEIKLTQFSRGAGCGCKIAPKVLEEILGNNGVSEVKELLVGNSSNDDAAVYDIGDGRAIISSTDFFMPVVNDPYLFGRIAAANAISDIYAMGGSPLMAIAILGWPVDTLAPSIAKAVLDGGKETCRIAGIPLAGGHSIDSTEPIFGLAVTGICKVSNLKKNNTAKEGDVLFLTKPIGVGILSTAQKRELLLPEHETGMIKQMSDLNSVGEKLGTVSAVSAMTDVTGFGLLGHLIEMTAGSNLSCELWYKQIPTIDGSREYLQQRIVPDATYRNWNAYNTEVEFEKGVNVMEAFNLLPDPQTNGGLLFSVDKSGIEDVKKLLIENGLSDYCEPIGIFTKKQDKTIIVKTDKP